jgi:hypothetical protein
MEGPLHFARMHVEGTDISVGRWLGLARTEVHNNRVFIDDTRRGNR